MRRYCCPANVTYSGETGSIEKALLCLLSERYEQPIRGLMTRVEHGNATGTNHRSFCPGLGYGRSSGGTPSIRTSLTRSHDGFYLPAGSASHSFVTGIAHLRPVGSRRRFGARGQWLDCPDSVN